MPRRPGAGRMTSSSNRPIARTAIPLRPRLIHVLVLEAGASATVPGRLAGRLGPRRSVAGIKRETNTKASDAHTGQIWSSCRCSQSRQTRAVRRSMDLTLPPRTRSKSRGQSFQSCLACSHGWLGPISLKWSTLRAVLSITSPSCFPRPRMKRRMPGQPNSAGT